MIGNVKVHVTPGTVVTGGHSVPDCKTNEPTPPEKAQAAANARFLESHPDCTDVYSAGVLSRRIGGGYYEHYRYLHFEVVRPAPEGPRTRNPNMIDPDESHHGPSADDYAPVDPQRPGQP